MKVKLRALDGPQKAQLTRQADRIATELEAQRELDGVCMVVDMVRRGSLLKEDMYLTCSRTVPVD